MMHHNVLLLTAADTPEWLYTGVLTASRLRVSQETDPNRAIQRMRTELPDVITVAAYNAGRGLAVVDRLNHENREPRIPLLLLAGESPPETDRLAIKGVYDGCLVAPVKPAVLTEEVRRLITLARVDAAFSEFARARRRVEDSLETAELAGKRAQLAIGRSRRNRRRKDQ